MVCARYASLLFVAALLSSARGQEDATASANGISIKVQGQSGKFTVFATDQGNGDPNKIEVRMVSLTELNADGEAVGTTGGNRHSVPSFATQDFTIGGAESVLLPGNTSNISATRVSFNSPIGSIGKIKVDTYIVKTEGQVGPDNETTWTVNPGDLKFNIELYDWTYCGCTKGGQEEVGEFIELDISVKGKSAEASEKAGQNGTFELGGGVEMKLTSAVTVDGGAAEMPAGYPKVSMKGEKQLFTFRFPKFGSSALYDPLLTTSSSDSVDGNNGGDNGGDKGGDNGGDTGGDKGNADAGASCSRLATVTGACVLMLAIAGSA